MYYISIATLGKKKYPCVVKKRGYEESYCLFLSDCKTKIEAGYDVPNDNIERTSEPLNLSAEYEHFLP